MASVISAGTTSTTALNLSGDTTGALALQTNGTTTAMTIDTSQNVGIGETSPGSYRLNIKTSASQGIYLNGTGTGGSWMAWANNGTVIGYLGSAYHLATSGSASDYSVRSEANLVFCTSANERMRITSGGALCVATTATTPLGSQTGASNVSTFNQAGITLTQYGVIAGFYYDRLNFNNSQYFVVNSGGTGVYLGNGSTSWTAYSDVRLKNITSGFSNALNDVSQLEPIKFTWKNDDANKSCVGLSAQSVEKVLPEAVDKSKLPNGEDETEYLAVRYTEIIPLLVAAIQELNAKVEAQAAEIKALKGVN